MVPEAAIIIIGDNDDAVLPQRAALDKTQQQGGVIFARQYARVAGVLIVLPTRFEEDNRWQHALLDAVDKIDLVFKMRLLPGVPKA